MAHVFSARSLANLKKVHPDLVRLHEAVLPAFDHAVTDGARSLDEQKKNVEKGVSKTLESKHLLQPDGYAHATDATPYPNDWTAVQKGFDALRAADPTLAVARFYYFQGVVRGIASQIGVRIRQGVDWDNDTLVGDQSFHDLPHIELLDPINK